MGVHGLQTFVEKHCFDVCEWVDIKTLAIRYKVETGRKPVIVVDGPSCLRTIYGHLNWMCGGQFKEFKEACIEFVKLFDEQDIKLVFFFDGPTVNMKRETWIERRKRNMQDIEMLFKWLESDDMQQDNVAKYMQLPVGIHTYSRYIFKHLCGCEVHASVKECDEEIAAYARRHNCFAILGQDSDFMIHAGTQYYFSINKLGFPSLNTINYNRWALARNLRISVEHLPLFASLMGNDIVPVEKLKKYHESISSPGTYRYRDIAHNIAKYIREIPMGNTVYTLLPLICRDVFHDPSMSDILAESIWSYLPQPDLPITGLNGNSWERILFIATNKHQKNEIPSPVFGVLKEMPYECGAVMEDFRKTDIPPTAITLRKARERLYTVLLHECPRTQTVHEWCVCGKDSLSSADLITVPRFHPFNKGQRWRDSRSRGWVRRPGAGELASQRSTLVHSSIARYRMPRDIHRHYREHLQSYVSCTNLRHLPVRHPGLRILWDPRDDDDTMNMRWGLVAWIMSSNMRPAKLKVIPTHLIVPAATLFYLINEVEQVFFEEPEIDLFIIMAITLHEHDCKGLQKIFVKKPIARGVRLATAYLRTAMQVFNTIGACGFPVPPQECLPHTYFDGKYFQDLYIKMSSGFDVTSLINNRDDYKSQYLQVKEFLTT